MLNFTKFTTCKLRVLLAEQYHAIHSNAIDPTIAKYWMLPIKELIDGEWVSIHPSPILIPYHFVRFSDNYTDMPYPKTVCMTKADINMEAMRLDLEQILVKINHRILVSGYTYNEFTTLFREIH